MTPSACSSSRSDGFLAHQGVTGASSALDVGRSVRRSDGVGSAVSDRRERLSPSHMSGRPRTPHVQTRLTASVPRQIHRRPTVGRLCRVPGRFRRTEGGVGSGSCRGQTSVTVPGRRASSRDVGCGSVGSLQSRRPRPSLSFVAPCAEMLPTVGLAADRGSGGRSRTAVVELRRPGL